MLWVNCTGILDGLRLWVHIKFIASAIWCAYAYVVAIEVRSLNIFRRRHRIHYARREHHTPYIGTVFTSPITNFHIDQRVMLSIFRLVMLILMLLLLRSKSMGFQDFTRIASCNDVYIFLMKIIAARKIFARTRTHVNAKSFHCCIHEIFIILLDWTRWTHWVNERGRAQDTSHSVSMSRCLFCTVQRSASTYNSIDSAFGTEA